MRRQKFKLWHSLLGTAALIVIEGFLVKMIASSPTAPWFVLIIAAVGAAATIYVATEIVEEVRGTPQILLLLSMLTAQFILFFSFEYGYLLKVEPGSFPTLSLDLVTLTLHSVMVFVFNPLYLPASGDGRALLLINTLGALAFVLFILQNIWQFRKQV